MSFRHVLIGDLIYRRRKLAYFICTGEPDRISLYLKLHCTSQSQYVSLIRELICYLDLNYSSVLRLKFEGCEIENDSFYPETLGHHLYHSDSHSLPCAYIKTRQSWFCWKRWVKKLGSNFSERCQFVNMNLIL